MDQKNLFHEQVQKSDYIQNSQNSQHLFVLKPKKKNLNKQTKLKRRRKALGAQRKIQLIIVASFIDAENSRNVMKIPKYRKNRLSQFLGFSLSNQTTQKDFQQDVIQLQKIKIEELNLLEDNINQNIKIPKPRTKHCYVCSLNFEDYLEHAISKMHKIELKRSKANKYIHQLCYPKQQKLQYDLLYNKDIFVAVKPKQTQKQCVEELSQFRKAVELQKEKKKLNKNQQSRKEQSKQLKNEGSNAKLSWRFVL